MREEKYQHVLEKLQRGAAVLDVGVWCRIPEPNSGENWLEKQEYGTGKLFVVGLNDLMDFKKQYPAALCVQANGIWLPFKDEAFEIAISNAVLEHVPRQHQQQFLQEITRVVKDSCVVAVPDRMFPVEIHSRIPLLHWLPSWRRIFRLLGETFFASEDNLAIIFTRREFKKLLDSAKPISLWSIRRQRFYGWPVSLVAEFRQYPRTENDLKGKS